MAGGSCLSGRPILLLTASNKTAMLTIYLIARKVPSSVISYLDTSARLQSHPWSDYPQCAEE